MFVFVRFSFVHRSIFFYVFFAHTTIDGITEKNCKHLEKGSSKIVGEEKKQKRLMHTAQYERKEQKKQQFRTY